MFVFRKIRLTLFSCNARFDIRFFASLPTLRHRNYSSQEFDKFKQIQTCLYYMVAFLCVGLYDHVLGRSYY